MKLLLVPRKKRIVYGFYSCELLAYNDNLVWQLICNIAELLGYKMLSLLSTIPSSMQRMTFQLKKVIFPTYGGDASTILTSRILPRDGLFSSAVSFFGL